MIGLTLVTLVAVLGVQPGRRAGTSAIKKEVHADYVIDGKDGQPFRAAEGDRLEQVRGRQERLARALRHGDRRRQGAQVTGIDPATIAHFYKFRWVKGSEHALGKLGTDGAIVTKDYAKDHHLAIGKHDRGHDALGRQAHARRARHPQPQDAAAGRRSA